MDHSNYQSFTSLARFLRTSVGTSCVMNKHSLNLFSS